MLRHSRTVSARCALFAAVADGLAARAPLCLSYMLQMGYQVSRGCSLTLLFPIIARARRSSKTITAA
jgi:hypothetical protein